MKSCEIGQQGESAAALFLYNKGMSILERNWRKGRFEIDLVCQDIKTLVFVEVRTRKAKGMLLPEQTLTISKRRNIIHSAQLYLIDKKDWSMPCRFDVICIISKKTTLELEHYKNVFEFYEIMDSSNTSWQPW